jgi:cob(I)alamin adenosyltransferase
MSTEALPGTQANCEECNVHRYIAETIAAQEASARVAEVARAAAREAERRLEDVHRQSGRPTTHLRHGRSENNVVGLCTLNQVDP